MSAHDKQQAAAVAQTAAELLEKYDALVARLEPLEQDLTGLTALVAELAGKNAMLEDLVGVLQRKLDAYAASPLDIVEDAQIDLHEPPLGQTHGEAEALEQAAFAASAAPVQLERAGQLTEGVTFSSAAGEPIEAFTSGAAAPTERVD